MADQERIRHVLDMRRSNVKKLLKNLKKNQQIISNKKKGDEVKAKARVDIQAIERELLFRAVLEDIKRVHFVRAHAYNIFEPQEAISNGDNIIKSANDDSS